MSAPHLPPRLLAVAGVIAAGGVAIIPSPAPAASADPALLEAGRVAFAEQCADCHGADGRGGNGPDVLGVPADVLAEAVEGLEEMPEIALTAAQIAAIAAWLAEMAALAED